MAARARRTFTSATARSGEPGDSFLDWIEAEQDLLWRQIGFSPHERPRGSASLGAHEECSGSGLGREYQDVRLREVQLDAGEGFVTSAAATSCPAVRERRVRRWRAPSDVLCRAPRLPALERLGGVGVQSDVGHRLEDGGRAVRLSKRSALRSGGRVSPACTAAIDPEERPERSRRGVERPVAANEARWERRDPALYGGSRVRSP